MSKQRLARFTVTLASLALVASYAGCGGADENNTGTGAGNPGGTAGVASPRPRVVLVRATAARVAGHEREAREGDGESRETLLRHEAPFRSSVALRNRARA